MAKIYEVTVKSDYRWDVCQVAGRGFSKRETVEIGEAAMNDEILNSPLLDITVVEKPETVEINATNGAKALADEHGIDLSTVSGSGSDGRILKADVEALIND